MYQKHRDFKEPDDPNAVIWRYTNFAKFVSLLDKKMLFFSQLTKLAESDPYEAAMPKLDREIFQKMVKADAAAAKQASRDWKGPTFEEFMADVESSSKSAAVNTWCMNDHESDAMWKVFTSHDEGVAIQSTFTRLCDSFAQVQRSVNVGLIKYIDYERDKIFGSIDHPVLNLNIYVVHKRKEFEHERELRAAVMLGQFGPMPSDNEEFVKGEGIYLPVDTDTLIDKVYVSPTSPPWLVNLIDSLLKQYSLVKTVIKSPLLTLPSIEN